MNVVLIGYRGSGKTQVGRELSRQTGWPLLDTDALIEQRVGQSIRDIFAQQGEPAFRDIEAQVIVEVCRHDRQIISVGGGAILRDTNVAALKACGKLVWLTAPPEVLWERIQDDSTTARMRPNLTAAGGLEEVRAVLSKRTPLYQAAADLVVDTSHMNPAQLGETIIDGLQIARL